jgi:hypothetical protein
MGRAAVAVSSTGALSNGPRCRIMDCKDFLITTTPLPPPPCSHRLPLATTAKDLDVLLSHTPCSQVTHGILHMNPEEEPCCFTDSEYVLCCPPPPPPPTTLFPLFLLLPPPPTPPPPRLRFEIPSPWAMSAMYSA